VNETDLGMVCPWPGIRGSTDDGCDNNDSNTSANSSRECDNQLDDVAE